MNKNEIRKGMILHWSTCPRVFYEVLEDAKEYKDKVTLKVLSPPHIHDSIRHIGEIFEWSFFGNAKAVSRLTYELLKYED